MLILFATYWYYQNLLFASWATFGKNIATFYDEQQAHQGTCKFHKIPQKFQLIFFRAEKYYINNVLHQQEFFCAYNGYKSPQNSNMTYLKNVLHIQNWIFWPDLKNWQKQNVNFYKCICCATFFQQMLLKIFLGIFYYYIYKHIYNIMSFVFSQKNIQTLKFQVQITRSYAGDL